MADGFHAIFKKDDISSRIERNKNDRTEYQSESLQLFFPWFSMGTVGEALDFGLRSSLLL